MAFLAPILPGIVSGIGSLFGGLFGSSSANRAAQQQVEAEQAAQRQLQQSEGQALGYQTNATNTSLGRLNPFLTAGTNATGMLSDMLGTPGQGLLTPWTNTFTAPTAAQSNSTQETQAQLALGDQAIQNSAAARGGLLSGQTLADMNTFGQQVASQNYQQNFNNALTQYNSAYNTFQNNQANAYNRLFGVSGIGQNAANTMGSLAQMGAQNFGNITTGTGADIASLYGAQGSARAAGTLGAGNAWTGALNNIGNTALQYGFLNQMNPGNWSSSAPGSPQTGPYTAGFPTGPYNPNYQPQYVQ